ncbi:dimethylamine monooxygenase subunit DmmA family protein [Arthrobacter gallicola]|uniref:dimethylamine monooxygenase subunit DmmA family protein n=1 Tax=Arthrobacter gallicola TaxID=2762225 RepID=UPI001CD828CF|nr:dimethylamine monooxygenase subunit DmmA family protein [Arthrobacter gallicola]
MEPVPLPAAGQTHPAAGGPAASAPPDQFVRYRIALAFTDADRFRMLEHLGSARAATITANFRPARTRARPGAGTDSGASTGTCSGAPAHAPALAPAPAPAPAPALYGHAEAQWLHAQLRAAVVGTQLVLAGPETDVLAARTDALAYGMVSAEILLLSRSDPARRVYCPHCRTITRTVLEPGSRLCCSGCHRGLEIFDHFSRHLAAYLGVAAGIEPVSQQEGPT